MTMVALLGHPAKSASPLPNTTVSTHCQFLKDSPATYPTPQLPETHEFYSLAVLRDIPTDVPTTAVADDYDDDDRSQCHPSISVDDITTIDPTFLQERDAFYTELLHISHSLGVSTQKTNEELHDSVTAASTADNDSPAIDDPDSIHAFLSELDDLHNELLLLLPQPSASSPHTPANDACETNDGNIEYANNDLDDNNDHDNAESSNAAYNKVDHDINERINNECDNTEIKDNLTGVATPRTNDNTIEHEPADSDGVTSSPPMTQETHTDTITPAGSIVAASDPPAAAEPDRITFLKELDALHNELTLMLLPRTFLPRTTDVTHIPMTAAMNNDRDHTVHISDECNNNETHHKERHHNDHSYAHHPHDNHASDNRVNEISDHADRTTDDRRHNDHQHDDKNKTNATEHEARDNKTCENDGCTKLLSPMRHSRQYTPTFQTIGHATHNQHKSQTDSAPSAMKQREVEMTKTDNKSDTTLAQLRILLAQLEEINNQFARWLDTLTIEKPTTTPDNTRGNQMNPLDAPTATTPTIIQSTPSQHNKHQAYTFLVTRGNDPTGGMFLLLSPSAKHLPNVRIPPWPPPRAQTKGPNQDLPWNHTQITNLLSTPDARLFRLMPHEHNPIWPFPILNHIPCPSDFTNKHDHKHVRFKTMPPCNPGPMRLWPKADLRPP